ncbi:FlgO family outer membrane protein [Thalassotalea profundi]|uniref:FlgO domain-containing protein n=1 Tax=Thalassotalea profundi TaxID=2036687 RepID=A0ABQ3J271_9GAMM|nr:FlgO family outer membrane protein [Thalassotalea profundi]GHF00275.1 hypothetical protein GCM10011501_32230 [Thalassotalea profundi]
MKYCFMVLILLNMGCSESPYTATTDQVKTNNALQINEKGLLHEMSYYDAPLIKNVNNYAKWLAQDLFSNLDFPDNNAVFVVADFALLDSSLDKTNHFGRQLTEALMHEVNRTGFSVIDVKATGFIRVNENGDVFFHSEDYQELSDKAPATNILTGTLTKHKGGYLVNARVISVESNALLTSAQAFIPYEVVDAVLLENNESETASPNIQLKAYSEK